MKYTKEQWMSIVKRQSSSALSIKDYCKEEGISPSCFYKYRRMTQSSAFVPVVLKNDPTVAFRLNGINIEVANDIDPRSLALILKAAQYD